MITVCNRKSLTVDLKPYCLFAKDHDFMEAVEWSNGEGYDICVSTSRGTKSFSLTLGEFDALVVLLNWKEDENESDN